MFFDGLNGNRPALGLSHHGNQARLREDGLGELVHSGGRCRSGWAYGLACNWVHRPHVVNNAVGQVDRKLFSLCEHVADSLVSSITSS